MAGKDPDPEDLPFEIPEFNEDEFVRKELISFRTTVILFVYALLVALTTFFIWRATAIPFFVVFLLAVAAGFGLPFIYKLFRVDISHFKRKEWFGTVAMHFFFWLGFTLLLSNPPISDNSAPVIEGFVTPSVQDAGNPMTFAVYAADNEGLEGEPTFCLKANGTSGCQSLSFARDPSHAVWTASWTPTSRGNYTLTVDAKDQRGLSTQVDVFAYVANPFAYVSPPSEPFNSVGDALYVQPAHGFRDLRAIQYEIGGKAYNMTLSTEQTGFWTTNPGNVGWTVGSNNVTILGLEQPVYLPTSQQDPAHAFKLGGGTARSASGTYTYTVESSYPSVGSKADPEKPEKVLRGVSTPAPDLLVVLAAVAALALVLRRTRRHE